MGDKGTNVVQFRRGPTPVALQVPNEYRVTVACPSGQDISVQFSDAENEFLKVLYKEIFWSTQKKIDFTKEHSFSGWELNVLERGIGDIYQLVQRSMPAVWTQKHNGVASRLTKERITHLLKQLRQSVCLAINNQLVITFSMTA